MAKASHNAFYPISGAAMNRFWLSFSLLALSTSARACINDRDSDSLAVQAKKLPDTLRVITGRGRQSSKHRRNETGARFHQTSD
jgi:hypothetical protein